MVSPSRRTLELKTAPVTRTEVELLTTRIANSDDLQRLVDLDAICFPVDDPDHQHASPGELESGVALRQVTVAVDGERIVGFLHVERPSADHAVISAIGVHPDYRRSGLASSMLDGYLESMGSFVLEQISLSTVTSPRNLPMLRILLSRGFVVRTFMKNYFGEERDRVYCQLRIRRPYVDPNDRYLVPVSARDEVESLLDTQSYAITNVLHTAADWLFEISRFDENDVTALQSNEYNAGIAFSTAMLSVLTFILGFSFASDRYPDGARALLVIATAATTLSLIVYANASGEIGRLRSRDFDLHMKWGNLLSEYGGVIPFILSLSLTFVEVTKNVYAGWLLAVGFSGSLLLYERSKFSMTTRYPARRKFRWPAYATSLLPSVSAATHASNASSWIWTAVAIVLLSWRIIVAAPSGIRESPRE